MHYMNTILLQGLLFQVNSEAERLLLLELEHVSMSKNKQTMQEEEDKKFAVQQEE
jgi:hypothetical protein